MSKVYSTPGVYIEEKSAFPNSVVAVATAVPAFIGYTEKAIFNKKGVTHEPVRISSFGEYLLYFGGDPRTTYKIKSGGSAGFELSTGEGNYLLYNSIKLFYANGGADCYIVSIGSYQDRIDKESFFGFTSDNRPKGLTTLLKHMEPTMLVAPDAILMSESACHSVQVEMLKHCGSDTKSRVAILDVYKGDQARTMNNEDVITKFREGIGQQNLAFGAAYYPWLETNITSKNVLSFENIALEDFDGLVTILENDTKANINAGLLDKDRGTKINAEVKKIKDFKPFLYLEKMQSKVAAISPSEVAQLDATDNSGGSTEEKAAATEKIKPLVDKMKALVSELEELQTEADKVIGTVSNDATENDATENDATENDATENDATENDATENDATDTPPDDEKKFYTDYKSSFDKFKATVEGNGEKFENLSADFEGMQENLGKALGFKKPTKTLHQALLVVHPLYKSIVDSIAEKINLLPPSAAMAGVYTMVDNNIGVFQSPANVSLGSVIKPTVNISGNEQDDLNVPLNGKAVNAIRTFPGKGVLVWGARTLDGNSLDWRYISVRRTVIMIEQSVKNAAEAYVFEPNTASTWANMKAMLVNFLTNVWSQGALAGATPEDAFSVDVGLGVTMTPVDILEGIMRISIKLAVTRPAEFIIITFEQQMQKS